MYPLLIRLGVSVPVQDFFQPYMQQGTNGGLLFNYQDCAEHYGGGYHFVPASNFYWSAGDVLLSKNIIIAGTAMDAIAYLTLNQHQHRVVNESSFLVTGTRFNMRQLSWLKENRKGKSYTLVFENTLLGNVADLKMAAGIRNIPVAVFAEADNRLRVRFRMRDYCFDADDFTLNRFEKTSGFRFGIRTCKSKRAISYLNQLKAGPFIPNL